MKFYSEVAVEKAMTIQEVLLRAYAGKISWIEAAEILDYSPRHLRRIREKHQRFGFHGLMDKKQGKPSHRRVAIETVEEVLRLRQELYHDFSVLHLHEKLVEEHGIDVSYTWTKNLLQASGLVAKDKQRKKHRKRRERRPLEGMMLHMDGSTHQWFQDGRYYDLITVMDDATSEVYCSRLVDEESTRTVMECLRHVVEKKGLFCQLYTDRGSHFFKTPKAGEPVDRQSLTQVGRAMRELGVQLIPSYSPQARGRCERSFRTWQGRLPQELRIRGITTVGEANGFIEREFLQEFNARFAVRPKEEGSAFTPLFGVNLDRVFSIQSERSVARDNTVRYRNLVLQIEKQSWRGSLAGTKVIVYEHLDSTITVGIGPHELGRYSAEGLPISPTARKGSTTARKQVTSPAYA